VGRRLGHAPTGTRRTKPAAFAAEGQQQLLAGVTAQSEKAMGEHAALQVIIKFALDIGGQALLCKATLEASSVVMGLRGRVLLACGKFGSLKIGETTLLHHLCEEGIFPWSPRYFSIN
jgi:hypothetical protein